MILRLFIAASATLLVASCGDDPVDTSDAPIDKSAAMQREVRKAQDLVKKAEKPAFVYSPIGKRDPFRSYLADLKTGDDKGKKRKLSETEQYEIDQYRLTGLITGTSQPKAMVEDPEGTGHVLKVGTRLGKNGGRVTRITATGIMIVEQTRDATGKVMRVPITIKLPQDPNALLGKK